MNKLSFIGLFALGMACGLATAQADNITLAHDTDFTSSDPAAVIGTDPGAILINADPTLPSHLTGIQPNWSLYTGNQAGSGGTLVFSGTYGANSFNHNGTATAQLYGSTMNLATDTPNYSTFAASNPLDFGTVSLQADSLGYQIIVTGDTAMIAGFNAGIAGTIKTLFIGTPVGNIGTSYVDAIGSGGTVEVLNIPLVPVAVPEPSTWAVLGMGGIAIFALRRLRASRIGENGDGRLI